jgi:hypothetical protein
MAFRFQYLGHTDEGQRTRDVEFFMYWIPDGVGVEQTVRYRYHEKAEREPTP